MLVTALVTVLVTVRCRSEIYSPKAIEKIFSLSPRQGGHTITHTLSYVTDSIPQAVTEQIGNTHLSWHAKVQVFTASSLPSLPQQQRQGKHKSTYHTHRAMPPTIQTPGGSEKPTTAQKRHYRMHPPDNPLGPKCIHFVNEKIGPSLYIAR
ncbi:hypothetical protein HOY82DRAFT_254511 [Tuber indicum]|nr:hypothetical protein HOY82DRAFT_254511 [Tuber indicum]